MWLCPRQDLNQAQEVTERREAEYGAPDTSESPLGRHLPPEGYHAAELP